MPEITARLSTALADRYKIESHLGEGGMAKHHRKVAIKVLPQRHLSTLVGLLISGLLSFTTPGFAQQGTWTKKADMPTLRWGLSTSAVAGRIYAMGRSWPRGQREPRRSPSTSTDFSRRRWGHPTDLRHWEFSSMHQFA